MTLPGDATMEYEVAGIISRSFAGWLRRCLHHQLYVSELCFSGSEAFSIRKLKTEPIIASCSQSPEYRRKRVLSRLNN